MRSSTVVQRQPRFQRQIITAPAQTVQVVRAGPSRAERRAVARARRSAEQQVVVVQQQQPRRFQNVVRFGQYWTGNSQVVRRGGGAVAYQRPARPQLVLQTGGSTQRVRVQQAPRVQYVQQVRTQPVQRVGLRSSSDVCLSFRSRW